MSCKKKNRLFLKILFPVLGLGSLLWFLARVVPKPSRAVYPCMRVAAPLASTFIIWLLGLGTIVLFFRQAREYLRKAQYVTATIMGVASALVGGILISSHHDNAFASIRVAPVGTAKGINPGRVIWMHDSNSTPWKGVGNGHWWENKNTNQVVVDQMMSQTLRALTGKPTDKAAWDTLFRFYNITHKRGEAGYSAGEKIAIKLNLTGCNYLPAYTSVDSMTYSMNKKLDYMNTSPQMVRALLRQLVNVAGIKQADISVGDPVTYYPNEFYDSCHAEFSDVHYIDHAGKFNRTKAEFSTMPIYWSSRPVNVKQDFVARHYAEASYCINLANMKSHRGGGITLCAKNHYGSFLRLPTDSGYYDLHQSLAFMTPQAGSYRALVDIMGNAHLGGKTMLYLIDGLYAGNHNTDTAAHTWSVAPFNGRWTSSLFASQDPVAVESVLFDLFQLDTDPYQYPKIEGASDYLLEAALANNPPSGTFYDPNHPVPTERLSSLGVFEHWNNPVDRKYSRNLGAGSGIELVFLDGSSSGVRMTHRSGIPKKTCSMRVLPSLGSVEFSIPEKDGILLALFDGRGRMIRPLLNGPMAAGNYRVDLGASTGNSNRLPQGLYFLSLYKTENRNRELLGSCAVPLLER
jgi:uncharacterized protein (DUF362 family)